MKFPEGKGDPLPPIVFPPLGVHAPLPVDEQNDEELVEHEDCPGSHVTVIDIS